MRRRCWTASTDTLEAVPHYGIGYGLLRYVYAPTARLLAAQRPPDIFFSYVGTIPELPPVEGPVQFDMDAAMPAREMLPGLGHAIELRVYRSSGLLHLDWWYDTRRLERATVEALVRAVPGRAHRADPGSDRRSRSRRRNDIGLRGTSRWWICRRWTARSQETENAQ